ncbi:MAG: porin family protein [Rikenellaceae bacterium]
MKKCLSLVLFALFFSLTSQAQDFFSFGPRVGVNFNSPSDLSTGLSGSTGWNVGLSAEIRPMDLLSVTVDAMYSKSTFTVSDAYSAILGTTQTNGSIGYIDIPILVNVFVFKGLHVKAGIQPSFKIGDGGIFNSVSDDIKSGAFAIPVGLGYTLNNGLNIDVRYNLGLSNMAEDSNIRNRQFVIGVGWRLF